AKLEVDGIAVNVRQTTDYPWDGAVTIALEPAEPIEFALRLRLPGWCRSAELAVNGEQVDVKSGAQRGYIDLRRRWQRGDTVSLNFAMPVERVYAHPDVLDDQGRVALKRGPILYCV